MRNRAVVRDRVYNSNIFLLIMGFMGFTPYLSTSLNRLSTRKYSCIPAGIQVGGVFPIMLSVYITFAQEQQED